MPPEQALSTSFPSTTTSLEFQTPMPEDTDLKVRFFSMTTCLDL